jgi:hypothetical protein
MLHNYTPVNAEEIDIELATINQTSVNTNSTPDVCAICLENNNGESIFLSCDCK